MAKSSHLPPKVAADRKRSPGDRDGSSQVQHPSSIAASCHPAAPPDSVLATHLKKLRLLKFRREYERVASECAQAGVDHRGYLLQLAQLEVADRQQRCVARHIRNARFPAASNLGTGKVATPPRLAEPLMAELMSCDFVRAGENVVLLGSGSAKIDLATEIGVTACRRGFHVTFVTAADLARQLEQARLRHRLTPLLRYLAARDLLIIDHLGDVPLSQAGADLLFEVLSQRHERCSTIVNSKLPVEEWISVFGREPLTSALIDRLTDRVRVVEIGAAGRPTLIPSRRWLQSGALTRQSREISTARSRPRRQPHDAEALQRQLELVGT